MKFPDIAGQIKRNLYNNYVAPIKNAITSGHKQGVSDAVSTKGVIAGALDSSIGAAIAKPKTPQQAIGVAAGFAGGIASTYVVGFVDSFGKSLGFWGK